LGQVKSRARYKTSTKILIDIFVNCNWVDNRWQWYSTHLHTNNI